MTSQEIANCLGDHHKAYYTQCTYKVYTFYYMWHWGEISVHINMHLFCYQKLAIRSRSVSVHLDLSYDALHAHRRGRGDNSKN